MLLNSLNNQARQRREISSFDKEIETLQQADRPSKYDCLFIF